MYRIKLGSGDESVFNSIEELSFGIGTGIIGQDAQIYHDRAEKWLPVTVHPAYKKAAAWSPPPDQDAAAGPAGNGNSAPVQESNSTQSVADDDGQDLMTLLNLEELAEFDPRNVQESAATQDPAEPPETQVAPAGELAQELEAPQSADQSDMVDLPVASDGDSAPSLESLTVPKDEEYEEPDAELPAEAADTEIDTPGGLVGHGIDGKSADDLAGAPKDE